MKLAPYHRDILRGESGPAVALALQTLVSYGEAFGAGRLVPVKSSHLAGSFGIVVFEAYLHILDRLAGEGAKVKVPTTVNPRPGRTLTLINRGIFLKQRRLERALDRIGVTPNYSCVCYDGANVPEAGDCLAWAESSAVQYANSVLGARTNRNSLLIDVCSAVTGVTPEFGYLLDEHRRASLLVRLEVERMDAAALGFLLGQRVVNRVPVIEHHPFSEVELKNMGGAMAASGAVALFHVEGLTPEAPDLKTALGGGGAPETMTVTQRDLDELRTPEPESADQVVFGCPQMTLDEALALSVHFEGRRVRRPTRFFVVPDALRRFRETAEYGWVRDAGVEVLPYCPLAALSVRRRGNRVLTSSGKLYYYLDRTAYGSELDCLRASGAVA